MSPEASVGTPVTLQNRTHYKLLELISPERASELGIAAEAPVFVSPYIREAHPCPHCSATYSPLVYQSGYTIYAQHMHDNDGGISLCVREKRSTIDFSGK